MTAPAAAGTWVERYSGEVVYLFAFDLAYEMQRVSVPTLLGQPLSAFKADTDKRRPRQLVYSRPQTTRLGAVERSFQGRVLRLERSVKLFPVGAISIAIRVPFTDLSLEELVSYHDLHFADGSSLAEDVRGLAERIQAELRPYLVRPAARLAEEEAYTVFCLDVTAGGFAPAVEAAQGRPGAEAWFVAHRRQVASLLTEEHDLTQLSPQRCEHSTSRFLSYYEHDLTVVDWDAALVVDHPANFEATLFIMETANLQLAEVEAYDRLLDEAAERAYQDLRPRLRAWLPTGTQRQLQELRVDLARLSDELSNITKFYGDWHLARLYQVVAERFYLPQWHHTIDEKLKTLDEIYQLLRHDQNNRWMFILEATIVLLFIVDLVLLFGIGK